MQSNGGVIRAREAGQHAVRTLLSGPAGGVVGAIETARLSGFKKVLGFDMGGTSTDVSLVGRHTPAYGGSLYRRASGARADARHPDCGRGRRFDRAGGRRRPAARRSGKRRRRSRARRATERGLPTVTDAHVVLGRIARRSSWAARCVARTRAAAAVDTIATALEVDRAKPRRRESSGSRMQTWSARSASVSVERGYDPREFALVAFGGCGGLHACEIAEDLGIRTVIVPEHAGVLSALGMLLADSVRDYSAGVLGRGDMRPLPGTRKSGAQ